MGSLLEARLAVANPRLPTRFPEGRNPRLRRDQVRWYLEENILGTADFLAMVIADQVFINLDNAFNVPHLLSPDGQPTLSTSEQWKLAAALITYAALLDIAPNFCNFSRLFHVEVLFYGEELKLGFLDNFAPIFHKPKPIVNPN